MQECIYLPAYDVWIRRRKHSTVGRCPAFSASCDDYYYSLLMLMLLHNNEFELMNELDYLKRFPA